MLNKIYSTYLVGLWCSWSPNSTYLHLDFYLSTYKEKKTKQGNLLRQVYVEPIQMSISTYSLLASAIPASPLCPVCCQLKSNKTLLPSSWSCLNNCLTIYTWTSLFPCLRFFGVLNFFSSILYLCISINIKLRWVEKSFFFKKFSEPGNMDLSSCV